MRPALAENLRVCSTQRTLPNHRQVRRRSFSKILSIAFLFCTATVIACSAQTLAIVTSLDKTDGAYPYSTLIQGTDGNFYGTTWLGGAYNNGDCPYAGCGTVFQVTPGGMLTTLHSFDGSDGWGPQAGLVQTTDGNFYGTTDNSGPGGGGTVFKLTPDGVLTTLHGFTGPDGADPSGQLIQARDGNFYGTTLEGGPRDACNYDPNRGCGTVFKLTPSGAFTLLYNFCAQANCTDGYWPLGGLVEGSDGNFYGTTWYGGISGGCGPAGCGTIFRITPNGVLTTLHRFNYADGYQPYASLMQARDGNFYGTTFEGGGGGSGTAFKITPGGTFTLLHQFCLGESNPCPNGDQPAGVLVQTADGNLYGTTEEGGNSTRCLGLPCGTIYRISTGGTWALVHSFQLYDGFTPYAGLTLVADGNLYGATIFGGSSDNCGTGVACGVIFDLELNFYALAVSLNGSGTITSTDGFINCPGTCSHAYSNHDQVTLNATPASGWAFGGWSGACSGSGACNLSITQSTFVSASFYQLPVTLTVSVVGNGTVTSTDGFINCPGTCTHTYEPGTPVTLNAAAASGWVFAGWTGACTGVGACNLTMTDNLSVTGVFLEPGHGLAFNAVPRAVWWTRARRMAAAVPSRAAPSRASTCRNWRRARAAAIFPPRRRIRST